MMLTLKTKIRGKEQREVIEGLACRDEGCFLVNDSRGWYYALDGKVISIPRYSAHILIL